MKIFYLLFSLLFCTSYDARSAILDNLVLTENDSIIVQKEDGSALFSWRATEPLVPASLTKLATAHLAINKWGLEHRFHTDFFLDGDTLWVKGYGDPFLVSEEFDKLIVLLREKLLANGATKIKQLNIDNSYFDVELVPGRSKVADPYNAPVSAVAANFNTVKLKISNGQVGSAEPQTPLTNTAKKMAGTLTKKIDRVNLRTTDNAQTNFAELLLAKLGWSEVEIRINQAIISRAKLVYRHENSHTLEHVLRGALEFSNNFIANQVFLKLADQFDTDRVSFSASQHISTTSLSSEFGWRKHAISEGSGLSRDNRLSAAQINDLLLVLSPHKALFKKIRTKSKTAVVYAKTGTLNGVRSYAGYIEVPSKLLNGSASNYRFVFNFNRPVPYRYRDQILEQLVADLERL